MWLMCRFSAFIKRVFSFILYSPCRNCSTFLCSAVKKYSPPS
uniref:Uncharacterized protein n=1 Tax=Anguilla anguilla TaxID=7936 RepID=A0A0E9XD05_ANGAN